MQSYRVGEPSPELVTVLDFLFGVDGEAMADKPVWEILDKVSQSVYPCPGFDDLDYLLETSPPVSVHDYDDEVIANLTNFKITDEGYVRCDVKCFLRSGLNHRQLSNCLSNIVRCAVQDYVVMSSPEETCTRRQDSPNFGF